MGKVSDLEISQMVKKVGCKEYVALHYKMPRKFILDGFLLFSGDASIIGMCGYVKKYGIVEIFGEYANANFFSYIRSNSILNVNKEVLSIVSRSINAS